MAGIGLIETYQKVHEQFAHLDGTPIASTVTGAIRLVAYVALTTIAALGLILAPVFWVGLKLLNIPSKFTFDKLCDAELEFLAITIFIGPAYCVGAIFLSIPIIGNIPRWCERTQNFASALADLLCAGN